MSEEQEQELQLSVEMVRDIQERLKRDDERAADSGVAAQYLAAVTRLPARPDQRRDREEEGVPAPAAGVRGGRRRRRRGPAADAGGTARRRRRPSGGG
ncbi:MAG: hypothetical protein U5K43_07900 [Halofilum sp. (in: g-proteobacteria)]|nr:hypothetical protein [Halofilum sp. (in: g-proteobacteria)]